MLQSISLGDFECKTPQAYVFHTQSMHPALHWICLHNYGHVIVAQYDFSGSCFQNIFISVETQYSTRYMYTVIFVSLGERLSTSYSCKCFLINSNCNNHPEVSQYRLSSNHF